MGLGDLTRKKEADAQASSVRGPGETIEQAWQHLRVDPGSMVGDADHDRGRAAIQRILQHAHVHRRSAGGVLDRVGQ